MNAPIDKTDWRPQRKIVAAAIATVAMAVVQGFGVDVPVGVEGAIAVIVGYFIPNA